MCLILFAWRARVDLDFVVAANRDEFYARPTAPMTFWENGEVLAGRDLQAGGTWMGVTRDGRFAAITNVREGLAEPAGRPSRGHLVSDFLEGTQEPGEYLQRISASGQGYNGFNLIVGDRHSLWYCSNRQGVDPRPLADGIYGLSNHVLDTPWPKVERGKQRLQKALESQESLTEMLLEALSDTAHAPDEKLPDTGVGLDLERYLSPLFIAGDNQYGTRTSTVFTVTPDGRAEVVEMTHDPPSKTRRFEMDLESRVVSRGET